jgi:drug/metabolite transporter (DMT)-like permease
MVILLGLAAAVLYGSGDFLGGMATRKAHVLTVLTVVETAGVVVALAAAVILRGPASLAGLAWGVSAGLLRGVGGSIPLAAAGAGVIDVLANLCYVAATRTGMFGLAVVLASLYPGVTVLLARVVLGERMRWVQRVGLALAAIGILLVAA